MNRFTFLEEPPRMQPQPQTRKVNSYTAAVHKTVHLEIVAMKFQVWSLPPRFSPKVKGQCVLQRLSMTFLKQLKQPSLNPLKLVRKSHHNQPVLQCMGKMLSLSVLHCMGNMLHLHPKYLTTRSPLPLEELDKVKQSKHMGAVLLLPVQVLYRSSLCPRNHFSRRSKCRTVVP